MDWSNQPFTITITHHPRSSPWALPATCGKVSWAENSSPSRLGEFLASLYKPEILTADCGQGREASGKPGSRQFGRGFEKCSDLPPPVVLLHNHNGPLLFSTHLQLGDVRLVLPPLPVGRDHNLAVPQLDPVLASVPPSPDLLDQHHQLVHAVPPPLLQLVDHPQWPDEDLAPSKGVFFCGNGQIPQHVGHSLVVGFKIWVGFPVNWELEDKGEGTGRDNMTEDCIRRLRRRGGNRGGKKLLWWRAGCSNHLSLSLSFYLSLSFLVSGRKLAGIIHLWLCLCLCICVRLQKVIYGLNKRLWWRLAASLSLPLSLSFYYQKVRWGLKKLLWWRLSIIYHLHRRSVPPRPRMAA